MSFEHEKRRFKLRAVFDTHRNNDKNANRKDSNCPLIGSTTSRPGSFVHTLNDSVFENHERIRARNAVCVQSGNHQHSWASGVMTGSWSTCKPVLARVSVVEYKHVAMVRTRVLSVTEQSKKNVVSSVEKKLALDLKEAVGILRLHEQSRRATVEFLHANDRTLDATSVKRTHVSVQAKARETVKQTLKAKKEQEASSSHPGQDQSKHGCSGWKSQHTQTSSSAR
eukprot:3626319-Amphidinium_carterae.1